MIRHLNTSKISDTANAADVTAIATVTDRMALLQMGDVKLPDPGPHVGLTPHLATRTVYR